MERVDVVVVGAGVVGLAVAERLAREDRTVVVLERHRRHGMETSSRNSEVLHSGIYYPTGSLKARLCVEGRGLLVERCRDWSLFHKRTGKLVAASSQAEVPELERLLRQGQANGIESLELVGTAAAAGLEPLIKTVAALWVPCTGIIDTEELMRHLLARAQERGAILLWNAELQSAERSHGGYRLGVRGMADPVEAAAVVNCAGLNSESVAAMPGVDTAAAGYTLHRFKGEYFRLRKSLGIKHLVYPVPEKHGLGIHLTLDRKGSIRFGPNSFPVETLDYDVDVNHKPEFLSAISRYLDSICSSDLSPDTAGIRPKLSADGSFCDFVIAEESGRGLPGWVNLVGIDSPGLTSCLAIARLVEQLLCR